MWHRVRVLVECVPLGGRHVAPDTAALDIDCSGGPPDDFEKDDPEYAWANETVDWTGACGRSEAALIEPVGGGTRLEVAALRRGYAVHIHGCARDQGSSCVIASLPLFVSSVTELTTDWWVLEAGRVPRSDRDLQAHHAEGVLHRFGAHASGACRKPVAASARPRAIVTITVSVTAVR
jgi:hypothetical protein